MKLHFPEPSLPALVIVDDCDDDVFFLRYSLREGGIANPILTFNSPREASAYFDVLDAANAKPALVFVEIRMPGDQGFEFIARLRERHEWDDVRVVVISSSNDPADVARAVQLRVDGYLLKFPPPDLLAEFVRQGPWFAVPKRVAELAGAV